VLRSTALVLALAVAAFASASELQTTLELSALRVEVTWIASDREMNRLRLDYGQPSTTQGTTLNGFSVLGKRDGEYVCLLFVRKPDQVNGKRTLALGHELLHCLLGEYH